MVRVDLTLLSSSLLPPPKWDPSLNRRLLRDERADETVRTSVSSSSLLVGGYNRFKERNMLGNIEPLLHNSVVVSYGHNLI